MKNKKILIIVFVVIVLVIITAILQMGKYKKVEKLSGIKFVDPYNVEITNYDGNKMPFTIEKTNEDTKIYVNGREYKSGERIYKIGEYEVKVQNGKQMEKSTIKINTIEKKEENAYNIYVISETLQTLLASLDLSSNVEQKGFLWTARTSTLDLDRVKENIPNIQQSAYNGTLNVDEFKTQVVPELKQYIQNILQQDENAYFKLYMEEDKFYLELELFGKIGLDDSRYDVTMYTDGTLGYVRQYEITENEKYERFQKEKADYFEIVDQIKNNTKETNGYPGSYLVDKESPIFNVSYNLDYMLISKLRKNIKFLMQYPECLTFADEDIAKEMENANIQKIVAQDEFSKLNENQKEVFFKNINLDKDELDSKYFTKKDSKYLIITGTTPFYENMSEEKFQEIIKKVSEDYGKEYTILYKPHPRALPTKEQEQFLNNLDIKVLPGKIPMEAIMFIYPNLQLGGFASSLYMSTDEGKTLFFFAKDKNELVSPLDKLYDTIFKDAKFYN